MSKFLESVNKRDFDRRISEVVEMLEEKQLYGTISLIKDLKYYLDLATKEKAHACNCQHNSNSRENESCCKCDSRQTNADRIRNMSDEELAEEFLADQLPGDQLSCGHCYYIRNNAYGCKYDSCKNGILKWLQSEAE